MWQNHFVRKYSIGDLLFELLPSEPVLGSGSDPPRINQAGLAGYLPKNVKSQKHQKARSRSVGVTGS